MGVRRLWTTAGAISLLMLCALPLLGALPLVLTGPSASAQVGVPYNSTLAASGGSAPYVFSFTAGSLPPGLSLSNTVTGAITGSPTASGTFTFTALVTDTPFLGANVPADSQAARRRSIAQSGAPNASNSNSFSITVAPAVLTLSGPSASAQVGVPYNSTLGATGGKTPYVFLITTGSLPPGLSLSNTATGAITGSPTAFGTFTFTASVIDTPLFAANVPADSQAARRRSIAQSGAPNASNSNSFSITVAPAVLTLSGPSASAQVGVPYNSTLGATGGKTPYVFLITTGSLPPGLSLSNTATGAITGSPTAFGTFTFTASVIDTPLFAANVPADSQAARRRSIAQSGAPNASTSNSFSITVAPAVLTLSGPSNASAQLGVPYNSTLGATGGRTPYVFSIATGSLPPGLSLSNTATGAITGTPTAFGTFTFTASVTDTPINSGAASPADSRRKIAQSGTPTATASNSFSITVAPAVLTLSGPASTAQVGVAYTSALTGAGGAPPYRYALATGSLPTGLNLNTGTGAITGTPTAFGTFNFTASVTDTPPSASASPAGSDSQAARRRRTVAQSGGHTASTSSPFSITVSPAAPSPTPLPPSGWMALTGLAGAGLFHLRQKRRAT